MVLLKEVGHWVLTLRFHKLMQGKVLFSWFLLPEDHDGSCQLLPSTISACYYNASHHEDRYWHSETVSKLLMICFILWVNFIMVSSHRNRTETKKSNIIVLWSSIRFPASQVTEAGWFLTDLGKLGKGRRDMLAMAQYLPIPQFLKASCLLK